MTEKVTKYKLIETTRSTMTTTSHPFQRNETCLDQQSPVGRNSGKPAVQDWLASDIRTRRTFACEKEQFLHNSRAMWLTTIIFDFGFVGVG